MSEDKFIFPDGRTTGDLGEVLRDLDHTPQPHTILGIRGQQEIKLKDIEICECFMRGWLDGATDYGHMGSETDGGLPTEKLGYHQLIDLIYSAKVKELRNERGEVSIDPMAVIQSGSCHMEKKLGIFPNIPKNYGMQP